jgi:hypothetical protein
MLTAFVMPNARPERREAKGVEMETGRAIPRPLQAACSAFLCLCS